MSSFEELAKVDCTKHLEKKGKFTYLSWPFAFAELFKRHPKADIEVRDWDGFPAVHGPKGWMVCISVTIDGVKRTQWHPVLDSNNKAIQEPDVFQINTSIQRGAVKAIALHGLGLYIYAGEDLPEAVAEEAAKAAEDALERDKARAADFQTLIAGAESDAALVAIGKELASAKLPSELITGLRALYSSRHAALTAGAVA